MLSDWLTSFLHKTDLLFNVYPLQDELSLDNAINDQIQPVIILANDLYESNVMYVVAEGVVLCEITTNMIKGAIVVLLATYYLFKCIYAIKIINIRQSVCVLISVPLACASGVVRSPLA